MAIDENNTITTANIAAEANTLRRAQIGLPHPGNGVDDRAYFRNDPEKYRNMSPDEAIWNADTYSMYEFEVIGKPEFSAIQ